MVAAQRGGRQRIVVGVDGSPPGEPVQITGKVVEGNAARVLLDESPDADLLVVGSRGHGGFVEALLGSTGQRVVQYATCPVVVLRGDEKHSSDRNAAVPG